MYWLEFASWIGLHKSSAIFISINKCVLNIREFCFKKQTNKPKTTHHTAIIPLKRLLSGGEI